MSALDDTGVEERLTALAQVPNAHMAAVAAGALLNVQQSPQRAQMQAAVLIQVRAQLAQKRS
jgi:hypothetical protein